MKGRTLLMIPGPVEFTPDVLQALGAPTTSHVAPEFIHAFGDSLKMMRKVWLCPSGQPFIVAGTGTLAMEMIAANLAEAGDKALVVNTGVFSERYAELLSRYDVEVIHLRTVLGKSITEEEMENALQKDEYKFLFFTHVDTSTGVKVCPEIIGRLGKKYNVLTILDGVCSVAGEEIRQEEWGIDVALTASQKAIGVPPGLALAVISRKAMDIWRKRKTKVRNYYCDWSNWLPVMEAYESGKPSYFATPAVNLVCALQVSLAAILREGMAHRFARHKKMSEGFKKAMMALGLKQVPLSPEDAANTLTAVYYPQGVTGAQFIPKVREGGAIIAGGLHPAIKDTYFRVGHMGEVNQADILSVTGAIEYALKACGHPFEEGRGVLTAQRELLHI